MGDTVNTLFGGGKQQAAQDYLNQLRQGWAQRQRLEGQAEQPFLPYQQQGQQAFQYRAGTDPAQFISKIESGYQESPAAQFQEKQGIEAIKAANAARGMSLSGPELEQLQTLGQGIASQDMERYLKDVLGIQTQDLQRGFGAASNISNLRNQLAQAGTQAYQGFGQAQYGADVGRAGGVTNLIGDIGGMAARFAGGAFGGPIGAAAGGALADTWQQAGRSATGGGGPGFDWREGIRRMTGGA